MFSDFRQPGAPADREQSRVSRGLNLTLGVALVIVCILAAVAALSYFLLLLGHTSSSILGAPEASLFNALGTVFTVILIGIAIRYAYYYYCWYTSRQYFAPPQWMDTGELSARDLPYLKFQVTTKGGALPVVERSLRILEATCTRHPWLAAIASAEVITERQDEADHLQKAFEGSVLDVTALRLPESYATPNGSRLKARALHYLVELRRDGFNTKDRRTFIVHFDEETVMTEPHVMILVDYLTRDPKPISQGPILYPLEWNNAPRLCQAIESTRPFGCSECARVMQNPPPPHLHGSNLVVDEAVENRVGWDFGTIDGEPFIAEDLLFGLRAYALLGEGAFGWHGATALEQPPLSLFWAVQQRMRWVLGALQGLRAMWIKRDYDGMPRMKKLRLSLSVYSRIATYSLGFPVGLTGLVFVFHPLANAPATTSPFFLLRLGLLASAVAWFASYQIGVWRNLQYQAMPWYERAAHHAGMLVITPIVGLCETVGPFVALVRWLFGSRAARWTPTPKLADIQAPASTRERETAPADAAPIPAWVFTVPLSSAEKAEAKRIRASAPPTQRRPAPRGPAFATARVLTAAGLAVGLFMAFEFLGTGLLFSRSQDALLTTFKENIVNGTASDSHAAPAEGDPVALIRVPRIGMDRVVVDGTSPVDLKSGPGHFRSSPMPGEFGNAVIVGRRTTYGGPFRDLDRLTKGDSITVTTGQGSFVYKVVDVHRTGAGAPDPLNGSLDSRLTLVTSDPAFVPDGRLAVVSVLQGRPTGVTNRALEPVSASDLGLTGDSLGLGLALFWSVILAAVIWVAWRFSRQWPLRVRYLIGVPIMLTLVVLVFSSVDLALPGTL